MKDLEALVRGINEIWDIPGLTPLRRSEELTELARVCVTKMESRANEDIDEWARALAKDVANADD